VVQAVFKQINNKTLEVVKVSAVGRRAVSMDTHPVVAVGLILATVVPVAVKLEMLVAGVAAHAAVEVLRTKIRFVVAVLAAGRANVKMSKHVVGVVGLMLAAMAAVAVKLEVHVVGAVLHVAGKVVKTAPRFVVAVLKMPRIAVWMNEHVVAVVRLTMVLDCDARRRLHWRFAVVRWSVTLMVPHMVHLQDVVKLHTFVLGHLGALLLACFGFDLRFALVAF